MRTFLAWCSFILVFNNICAKELSAFGYHERIGIALAEDAMKAENSSIFTTVRVIGGQLVTAQSSFPYQAGIIARLTTGWTSICGGSLISQTAVLTAAHCWWDGQSQAQLFTVVLGSLTIFNGGTRIDTTNVVMHPNWNINDITFDIAVAKITSVQYTNNIQAIPLPSIADVNQGFSGLTATASGYGKTSDAQNSFPTTTALYHTTVTIITNTVCQSSMQDVQIHGSHICTSGAGGVGTCEGDSGGPLTVVWNNVRTLVGVVSFGFETCESKLPSVYTRVTVFLTWIQANI